MSGCELRGLWGRLTGPERSIGQDGEIREVPSPINLRDGLSQNHSQSPIYGFCGEKRSFSIPVDHSPRVQEIPRFGSAGCLVRARIAQRFSNFTKGLEGNMTPAAGLFVTRI